MILHENRLPADDSHEISCLIKRHNLKLLSAANYRWRFMGYLVNDEASSRVKYNLGLNDCLKINLFCSRIVARQSATILTVLFSWAHTSWRKFHLVTFQPFNKSCMVGNKIESK